MAELNVSVKESRLGLACYLTAIGLKQKSHSLLTYGLGEFFPDILSEWSNIKIILENFISRQVAWTGKSMTKSDNVPDDTHIPPQVEVNKAYVRIALGLVNTLGVTLSEDHVFDDSPDFEEAQETWYAIARIYSEIDSLCEQMDMYRMVINEFDGGTATIGRSAAQLLPYRDCPIPLVDVAGVNDINLSGIGSFFGIDINLPASGQMTIAPPLYTYSKVSGTSDAKTGSSGGPAYYSYTVGNDVLAAVLTATGTLTGGGALNMTTCGYLGLQTATFEYGDYDLAPPTLDIISICYDEA